MQKLLKAMHKNEKGFTLVELMVVVVIIGILVAIAIPIYGAVQRGAAQRAHDANLRTIDGSILMYYSETGSYPSTGNLDENHELATYLQDIDDLSVPEAIPFDSLRDQGGGNPDNRNYRLAGSDADMRAYPVGTWDGAYRGTN